MTRILVINDYSLQFSWDCVRRGESPAHFLYGVDHLAAEGFELDIVSDTHSKWLAALDRRMGRGREVTGSFDRQTAAISFLKDADLIYAPCESQTQILTYLRAIGIIRIPIVCLAHHPIVRGRFGRATRPFLRLMLRGMSAMPSLSAEVATEINALASDGNLSKPLRWGPDADFYPPGQYPGLGILAAGRTARDFVTFGRAATAARVPATILCFRSSIEPEFELFGTNVTLITPDVFLAYSESVRLFAAARALAIPMVAQDGLCGLTSLMDALGAGKPVIMTRNRLIDLDIEALGIGRWVEPGDVDGWIDALRFFENNPDEAASMGRRARSLVGDGLDYRSFSRGIYQIIRERLRSAH
jgi:hypothetical protein